MTDFEKTKKLFDEFGIGYEVGGNNEAIWIALVAGEEKIGGYYDAEAAFCYDINGKFTGVGV